MDCEKPSVTIEVAVKNGEIFYNGTNFITTKLEKNQTIEWVSEHLISINFGWNSPFKKVNYTTTQRGSKNITATIRGDVPNGDYKYTVAVYDKEGEQILIDDPRLIIPPPGG